MKLRQRLALRLLRWLWPEAMYDLATFWQERAERAPREGEVVTSVTELQRLEKDLQVAHRNLLPRTLRLGKSRGELLNDLKVLQALRESNG